MEMQKYLNAIIYDPADPDPRRTFKKYHAIKDQDYKKDKFLSFVKNKFPNAEYINFYYKQTRKFKERIYLK